MRLEQETSSYSFEISGQIFKCKPGFAKEAHCPVGVGADQTQDDELLLAALVAVHGPHLYVLERGFRPEEVSQQLDLRPVGRDDANLFSRDAQE